MLENTIKTMVFMVFLVFRRLLKGRGSCSLSRVSWKPEKLEKQLFYSIFEHHRPEKPKKTLLLQWFATQIFEHLIKQQCSFCFFVFRRLLKGRARVLLPLKSVLKTRKTKTTVFFYSVFEHRRPEKPKKTLFLQCFEVLRLASSFVCFSNEPSEQTLITK